MKRTAIALLTLSLTLCLTLSVLVIAGSPAQAARKKKFHDVTVKVVQEYGGEETSVTPVAFVCVGYVRYDDEIDRSCPSYSSAPEFVASVKKFKATFRWYAGSKVIRKRTVTVKNHTSPVMDSAPTKHLSGSPSGTWTWKGKKLSLKVTLSKKGYKTKTVRIAGSRFSGLDD